MNAVWAQILSAVLGVASTVAVRLAEDYLKRRAARRPRTPALQAAESTASGPTPMEDA